MISRFGVSLEDRPASVRVMNPSVGDEYTGVKLIDDRGTVEVILWVNIANAELIATAMREAADKILDAQKVPAR